MAFELKSSAFPTGGTIPRGYTCDGKEISPPLEWSDPPASTLTLALIVEDPDAPRGTWTHWVVYNIPATSHGLVEAMPMQRQLADGTTNGKNSWGRMDYGGPCPPSGMHRYFFRLYALDAPLAIPAGSTVDAVRVAMQGHVLGQADLMGKYGR